MSQTILYSFRRCPYAMRARLAIAVSGIMVELREVALRNKPHALLQTSPKGTVPVLVSSNTVIDESLDIMYWALRQADPQGWLSTLNEHQLNTARQLIEMNDNEFKTFLDRYKYADRYPEHPQVYYRQQAENTLQLLEQQLAENGYLVSPQISIADIAILPFIRQFSFVDNTWFDSSPYPLVKIWLDEFLNSSLFERIMLSYPAWQEGDLGTNFPR
ncbi:MAG: glutathione S-transferase [Gammaproteobacteria bacterium]|nr:glutathione S-transferase [Gammaproteobacteria bacterium]